MRFKLDENLHSDTAQILVRHGHDATTVFQQNLSGCTDSTLAQVCMDERRVLLTLDLDFADIRAYPPAPYAGIIVLRLRDHSRISVMRVVERLVPLLDRVSLAGRLWIVDEKRVRMRGRNGPVQLDE